MNFFGHDSNASNDPRLKKVLIKYGYEGYGLYFHILELIARHLDPPREQTCQLIEDAEILSADSHGHSSEERITEIIEYMKVLGLFIETDGKLFNPKILRRLSDAQKKKVRRTNDGQETDTVRCEVKEGIEGSEVNRIEVKEVKTEKPKDGSNIAPMPLQLLWKEETDLRNMLQNPKYGSDMIEAIKGNLTLNLKKQKQFAKPSKELKDFLD